MIWSATLDISPSNISFSSICIDIGHIRISHIITTINLIIIKSPNFILFFYTLLKDNFFQKYG